MKNVRVAIVGLSDGYHRYTLSDPRMQERLKIAGVSLDSRGIPRHPFEIAVDVEDPNYALVSQGERH